LNSLAPILLFGVLLAFVIIAFLRLKVPGPPYEKRRSLLTEAELRFYGVLRKSAEDWAICSMVRIADLIRVKPNTPKRQAWLNRILAKHVDFVLCNPETMEVVLAIELDDRSHERADRIERDEFVDGAFKAAGLPLLRVKVQDEYDGKELKASIAKTMSA
jgi:hypothetical protein